MGGLSEHCSVLYCVLKVVHRHKHTWMNSSYSSLDWVLSHWAHFTVRRFLCLCIFCVVLSYCICVVLLYHGGVDLVRLKPNPWTSSFSALTLLVRSFDPLKPVPDMTYSVLSGTLNLTQQLSSGIVCAKFKLRQAIRSWNVTIFYANTSYHAMTLRVDPLTLKVCGRTGVTWS